MPSDGGACPSGRPQSCFREASVSNLGRSIGRRDGGFSLYPSVPLRKYETEHPLGHDCLSHDCLI